MSAKNGKNNFLSKRFKHDSKQFWKKTKIFIIFAIAVFAFAILGLLPNSGGIVTGGVAAMVNGKVVSRAEFLRAVSQEEERLGSLLGNIQGEYRQRMLMQLRQSALNRLISLELIQQTAAEHGVYATDEEIRDLIVETPAFQDNGRFSQEKYFSLLEANRLKAGDYEEGLRRQIVTQKMLGLFSSSVVSTDMENEVQSTLQNSKMNIEFVRFGKSDLKVNVSPADVKAYLTSNIKDVEDYYKANKTNYSQKEQVKALHILAKFTGKDDKAKAAAKEKIDKAQERLKTESFDVVAKELSDDPGSAAKGGDLGFFTRGRMVKPFEEVAFTLKKGEVSGVVETDFGYHIIKLIDKKPESTQSLEEVQEGIAKALLQEAKADMQLAELKKQLESSTPKQVGQLIKSNGLKWEETGEFTLNQPNAPKLGDDERLLEAAMSLKPGGISPKVVTSRGKSYILKLKKLNIAKAKDSKAAEPGAGGREVFDEWFKTVHDAAKIKPNEKLLAAGR